MADGSVAVVGGGITGLATAWFLRQSAPDLRVTLVDAGDRLGGKIQTRELADVPVEDGPDCFLARVPWATDLCRELGLGDDLVAPATGRAYVWARGRLRPLPEGLVLGVPARLGPLARSGIVSVPGLARAAIDLVRPGRPLRSGHARRPPADDASVADVIGGRFGREVVDHLVEPLLGGIHAGRADQLSLEAVAPQVAGAAARSTSLLRALRTQPPADGPVFLAVAGGMGRLVERLAEARVDRRLSTSVTALERADGGGWTVRCSPGPDFGVDRVVVAVPAFAAAGTLAQACPAAATELGDIAYASVVTVTLAYRPGAITHPLDGSGFLVPRVDGRLITACTWSTSKWPALASSGLVMLRASCGRIDDERAMEMDDDDLVRRVQDELALALGGIRQPPVHSRVTRWPRSLPQYVVGHRARVERIESALAESAHGVHLAGAAYRGLGIAACIRQAKEVAGTISAATAPV